MRRCTSVLPLLAGFPALPGPRFSSTKTEKAPKPKVAEKKDVDAEEMEEESDEGFFPLAHVLTEKRHLALPVLGAAAAAVTFPAGWGIEHAVAAGVGVLLQRVVARGMTNGETKDLSGKTALVTGGTSGIGWEVAVQLANMGGAVVVAAPKEEEAAFLAKVKALGETKGSMRFAPLDLFDLHDVKRFASKVCGKDEGLHFLINCAATVSEDLVFSKSGVEKMIGVNFLGPFMLTELLVPRIQKVKGRVVYAGCASHAVCTKTDVVRQYLTNRLDNESFFVPRQYGISKLGNIYHTHMLSTRPGFTAVCANPGVRWSNDGSFLQLLYRKTSREASQTILNAALRDDAVHGGYYAECRHWPAAVTKIGRSEHEAASVCNWAANRSVNGHVFRKK